MGSRPDPLPSPLMATLTTAYSTPHVHQQYMDNAQATNALLADDASFADQAHGEEEEYINTFFGAPHTPHPSALTCAHGRG